jgi:hypothetical protein
MFPHSLEGFPPCNATIIYEIISKSLMDFFKIPLEGVEN